ncbi:N-acetyl-gamma-glutamyl-phosphate reductase [Aciduricibacillus chroicocephali]|uniref:N-acetyl-gamma-glutamyl-phosphate reductase n=1 Tax=Aciduricibacillus chroicocephali TaxID=3054939 RepID=A0ABY9KWL3_9BACI|nr:N-acetyl-gamma-glutamyl-phosphate reductase [Bacillaceae bacterium 44XB]
MKISIIGATGYGGAELIRILHQHPEATIHSIHSSSQQGKPLHTSYPHVQDAVNLELEDIDPVKIANETDVVFAATPSGVSSKLIPQLMDAGAKVIDLSGDFRLKNTETYESWYKKPAGDQKRVAEAVYGLTEWFADDVKDAQLVANPGCYPTATLLGLAPLVKNGIIDLDSIIIDAKSGVSGAGRGASPIAHFPEMNDNLKVYKVNEHQHIPEIEQTLGRFNALTGPVSFTTHLVPMTRGIMTTMYAKATEDFDIDKLHDLYKETYANNYFVRIREKGLFPGTREVCGSNFCDIGLAYCERTGRITVVSVIDNVMKGAAGQAVQNMNVQFGLDETTGLDFLPIYP